MTKYICECGMSLSKVSKYNHLKSERHTQLLEAIEVKKRVNTMEELMEKLFKTYIDNKKIK